MGIGLCDEGALRTLAKAAVLYFVMAALEMALALDVGIWLSLALVK